MHIDKVASILEKKKREFSNKGYVVFKNIISSETLEILRSECDRLTAETDAQLEKDGIDVKPLGIGIGTKRKHNYFFSAYKRSLKLRNFIFSDLTEDICRTFLGNTAFLYYESFVIKCPKGGLPFGWHQDSAYIKREHKPFITLWCALDDVSDANGSLRILPYDRAGTKTLQPHIVVDPPLPQIVGYFGDDPGDSIEIPAGSIVIMSSTTFHCSSPNVSKYMRRAYLISYSIEPILSENGTKPKAMAEAFLKDNNRVA